MRPSTVTVHPPAWIRNTEQDDWIVIQGRNGTDYYAMGDHFPYHQISRTEPVI